jgi:mannan endo-1,4-beta-mannosidase
MKKRIWQVFLAALLSMALLVGCGNDAAPTGNTQTPQAQETATPAASLIPSETSTPEATETPVATPEVTEVVQEDTGTYDPSFSVILQAEEAELHGNVRVDSAREGYTGTGYLTGFEGPEDTVIFTVAVPGSGAYDLNFISVGNVGHKENDVLVDGEVVGVAKVDGDVFTDSIIQSLPFCGRTQDTSTQKLGLDIAGCPRGHRFG